MNEQLSAALDGQAEVEACDAILARLKTDADLRERWDRYCLIGDAMRGETMRSPGFVAGVMAALENEPTVLAPPERSSPSSRWSQRVLPIAASVMGVAAVGWIASSVGGDREAPPRVVQPVASVSPPAPPRHQAVARQEIDPHREYVFIHQASSLNSPLPGVAQYVRSVSEVQDGIR